MQFPCLFPTHVWDSTDTGLYEVQCGVWPWESGEAACILSQVLLLPGCVILNKLFSVSEPPFPAL